ncbi:MAG: reverse transcriptase domain-containing protein, partial [Nitrososphaerales archaeon]
MVPTNVINPLDQKMSPNSMDDISFCKESVLNKLKSLKINKSPGPDLIHPKVLYELRDIIAPYLSNLFEQSVVQGKIPNDWKMSSVTVIHKKGKKNCVENYRPISLTCISCKIMESLIRDHIMEFFKSNNLFSNFQYGFITGRNTTIQLLKVLDDWTSSIDKGNQVDIVY